MSDVAELSDVELAKAFELCAVRNNRVSNHWRSKAPALGEELLRRFPGKIAEAFFRAAGNSPKACKLCQAKTSFLGLSTGYATWCSTSCAAKAGNGLASIELHPMRRKQVAEKRSATYKRRHGGIGFGSPTVAAKICDSLRSKHGADHNWQVPSLRHDYLEARRTSFFHKLFKKLPVHGIQPRFELAAYGSIHDELPFTCLSCQTEFSSTLIKGLLPRCPSCMPKLGGTSALEQRWLEIIRGIAPADSRVKVNGVEVDVLAGNVAVEINGLYWHSSTVGYDPTRHLLKTERCAEVGIKLIHLFEDDLLLKPEVVTSLLTSRLGKATTLNADQTSLVTLDTSTAEAFFDRTHLLGATRLDQAYGLLHNDQLVACAGLADSKDGSKLLRFSTELNTNINRAVSKLLSNVDQPLTAEVDRATDDGAMLLEAGWLLTGSSPPACKYWTQREPWRRDKSQLLEQDASGCHAIYDCGTLEFAIQPKKS